MNPTIKIIRETIARNYERAMNDVNDAHFAAVGLTNRAGPNDWAKVKEHLLKQINHANIAMSMAMILHALDAAEALQAKGQTS